MITASPEAIAAAEKALGCEKEDAWPGIAYCEYHGRLTDRGCSEAVAVADAVATIADQEQTMLRAEAEMWHDALITMATTLSRAETRAEAAEAELAETRQRLALALDALVSAVQAADTGRSPDQERLVLHELERRTTGD